MASLIKHSQRERLTKTQPLSSVLSILRLTVCGENAKEETGVEIARVRALGFTNDVFEESGLHYITLWMTGEYTSGEAVVAAPYEASQVGWFAWDALPEPLFLPLRQLLQGKSYPSGIEIRR